MAEILESKSSASPASKPAAKPVVLRQTANDYLVCRFAGRDDYSVWSVDINRAQLLEKVPGSTSKLKHPKNQIISIGSYILEWGPISLKDYTGGVYPYRLFEFDADSGDPLGEKTIKSKLETSGLWKKDKFHGTHADLGNPEGPSKAFQTGEKLLLVPLGTFILNIIPTLGRGTHRLFSFDPGSEDPLYKKVIWTHGSFETIEYGHELIPMRNYVLDRVPKTKQYWLWSFDPMNEAVLPRPWIQRGTWDDIDETHKLTPIGDYVLDWDVKNGSYRLWRFNPDEPDPVKGKKNNDGSDNGLVQKGTMPPELQKLADSNNDWDKINLTGVQRLHPSPAIESKVEPGTVEFMRTKIKHVVYYMLENRSFDHVCGWLYNQGANFNRIGHFGPGEQDFDGASESHYNIDPETGKQVPVDREQPKNIPPHDPYHDMTDTIRQCFSPYGLKGDNRDGYANRDIPDMGGFVWNNGMKEVMSTFAPSKLPVLNGLAKDFAVSDRWFCSMPGATDSQRAFSLTGSALLELNNFMNGPEYVNWPEKSHRASIWKVLWANGFRDWKIYNSVPWFDYVLTYHLFLKGQVPTVDKNKGGYIGRFEQFLKDAESGNLPTFSYLEPVWIQLGPGGAPATSYHPYGNGGTEPGEAALNQVYKALRGGAHWDETLLIITFDEHGGFYDHVPPPSAVKPWPHDQNDGFNYDLLGVRVPTILVSPWIQKNTVFRAPENEPAYDSTSILATLLKWYGIPRARWWLGDRAHQAPTFEQVFTCPQPRNTRDEYPLPPSTPTGGAGGSNQPGKLDDCYEVAVPRLVEAIIGEKCTARETCNIAAEILERATDVETLNNLLNELAQKRQWRPLQ